MRLEASERVNLTLSAGAVAASFVVAEANFAASLALGAALEAVNLRGLHASARALFSGGVGGSGPWVGAFGLRFVVLAVGIALALRAGADPLGLVIGLSLAIPATVTWALRNRPPVVPAERLAALPPDDPSWDRYSIWRCQEVEPEEPDEGEHEVEQR
jgi:hypothetical protein